MSENLRFVRIPGMDITIRIWFIGFTGTFGKPELGYELCCPPGNVMFSGRQFYPPFMEDISSDDTLRALVGFLSLRPGDTDADYFKDYTPAQMEFCQEFGEQLGLWATEYNAETEDGEQYPFEEIVEGAA